jgi:hypothetical protein
MSANDANSTSAAAEKKKVLYDSIADLATQAPVDMTKMVRP